MVAVQGWVAAVLHSDERGAAATEYVLLILGVVLFMIIAAFGLRDVLNNAVSAIGNWINSVNPPVIP